MIKKIFFILLSILILGIGIILFGHFLTFQSPAIQRDWNPDQQILSTVTINQDQITIQNVRNFDYTSETEFTPNYYDQTYDLEKLIRAWYLIEPFGTQDGPAHTMISFDFEDNKHLTISAEIRKEKGESFSPIKGLFNQYELVYMIGDERDLIRLRSNYRNDDVYMYPLQISETGLKSLFVNMVTRAEELRTQPEFYHTIWNTCTTVLQDHANQLLDKKITWNKNILLPKYSDEILYKRGLIDTDLSLSDARKYYLINQRAKLADQDPEFSTKIRPKILK